jgi:hypothetical protein
MPHRSRQSGRPPELRDSPQSGLAPRHCAGNFAVDAVSGVLVHCRSPDAEGVVLALCAPLGDETRAHDETDHANDDENDPDRHKRATEFGACACPPPWASNELTWLETTEAMMQKKMPPMKAEMEQ